MNRKLFQDVHWHDRIRLLLNIRNFYTIHRL